MQQTAKQIPPMHVADLGAGDRVQLAPPIARAARASVDLSRHGDILPHLGQAASDGQATPFGV